MIWLRDDGKTIELVVLTENGCAITPIEPDRVMALIADGAAMLRRRLGVRDGDQEQADETADEEKPAGLLGPAGP